MNNRSVVVALLCLLILASVSFGQFGQPQGNYGRPQIPQPNIPRPNIPTPSPYQNTPPYQDPGGYYYEEVKVCENCNNEVSDSSSVGMKCPHCGIKWGYDSMTGEGNSDGNIRWGRLARVGIFILVIVGCGIGALAKKLNK